MKLCCMLVVSIVTSRWFVTVNSTKPVAEVVVLVDVVELLISRISHKQLTSNKV